MVLGDVHGLLRGPGALDRRVGKREDGVAALEILAAGVAKLFTLVIYNWTI